MKEWLEGELPVEIPDNDALHGELCNVGFKPDSTGRIQLESKIDIKKRGLPSPDGADSLSLTMAGGKSINIQSMMPKPHVLEKLRREASMFH